MSRIHARHGQAPYVGQTRDRAQRPTPSRLHPWAILVLLGAIVLTAGYIDGLIPW